MKPVVYGGHRGQGLLLVWLLQVFLQSLAGPIWSLGGTLAQWGDGPRVDRGAGCRGAADWGLWVWLETPHQPVVCTQESPQQLSVLGGAIQAWTFRPKQGCHTNIK